MRRKLHSKNINYTFPLGFWDEEDNLFNPKVLALGRSRKLSLEPLDVWGESGKQKEINCRIVILGGLSVLVEIKPDVASSRRPRSRPNGIRGYESAPGEETVQAVLWVVQGGWGKRQHPIRCM